MATNDLDLLFSQAPLPGSGPVELVFGDDDNGPVIAPVIAQASGRITGIRAPLLARVGVRAQIAGRITGLRQSIAATYDINASRPTVGQAVSRYQQARPVQAGAVGRYQQSGTLPVGVRQHWQAAQQVQQSLLTAWQESERLAQWVRSAYQQALAVPALPTRQHWQEAERLRSAVITRFEEAVRTAVAPSRQNFQEALHLRSGGAQHWQNAAPMRAGMQHWASYGVPVRVSLGGRYQEAWPPRPGITPIEPPIQPPCYVPSTPVHLVFSVPAQSGQPVRLVFKCDGAGPGPDATVVVPIKRVYVVINNITLHRVDTGAELHAHGFNMSLDYQSWTWSWSASLHHDAAAHLGRDSQGDPAELEVVVNGLPFRLRLERLARDRRFNPTRWAVGGRGKAAILDAPHAPTMNFGNSAARTAHQLMGDALTVNGVSLGWGVDWGLTDWLVPAGAWALQGPYIAAINDIAGAVGGYVQPHPTDAVLRVLPRYPAAPWAWDSITPDFELPADIAEVEGIDYIDKPAYNRVFVGGVGAGVFGPFKRAGTAGESLAPMVTHPLITHADAHRQRGLAEISDTGRQEHVSLNLQVLQETGVIMPGQFVRYLGDKTYMGIVRSTSIDWSRPKLRQTIGIETHA